MLQQVDVEKAEAWYKGDQVMIAKAVAATDEGVTWIVQWFYARGESRIQTYADVHGHRHFLRHPGTHRVPLFQLALPCGE